MKKHFLFTAALFATLSLGFVSCENPDDEPGFSLENVGQEDADDKNDANSDGTTPSTPEKPTLIATGDVTDLTENSATFWGRLNTDTLWALPNVKWGVEYAYDREAVSQHKHQETTKVNCTAGLQGANMDEFSVTIDGLQRSQTIYYSAYILINDMKYVYGELDSVRIVKLTLKPNNSDYGTVEGSGYYEPNTEVAITAIPNNDYIEFVQWSDGNTENPRTITVTSDSTITANFSLNHRLTVQVNNSNYGTVTGSGLYEKGTEATITATPKANYYFTSWSDGVADNPRTVEVNSDTTFTANFAKKPYLTVNTNNTSYGTVTGSGYYMPGDEVTITATPNNGYIEFVQWRDGNTENPRTVTVTSDVTYTATFKVNAPDGAFSVSSSKYVVFSPGNLQYTQSIDTWSFAENQWDYIGTDNVTGGEVTSDEYGYYRRGGTALADKVDLFGWSTIATYFGVSTSTDIDDYSGSFVDWGSNQIGDDVPNTWRTLTYDEWYYLCYERPNYDKLIGVAQVNGVNGLILLPDGWTSPAGITFKSGFHDDYGVDYYAAYQTFTADQWSKMEQAGAVFLPAAGYRGGSDVGGVQYGGYYWSATEYGGTNAYYLAFSSDEAGMDYGYGRYFGLSVRLVKDL